MGAFDAMRRSLRLAVRRLFRAPLYSLSVCAALALAGAALTATGVIAYGILLSPLPYDEPSELVFLQRQSIRTGGALNFTPADFLDVAQQSRTLESVAAAGSWSPVITGVDAAAERVGPEGASGDAEGPEEAAGDEAGAARHGDHGFAPELAAPPSGGGEGGGGRLTIWRSIHGRKGSVSPSGRRTV